MGNCIHRKRSVVRKTDMNNLNNTFSSDLRVNRRKSSSQRTLTPLILDRVDETINNDKPQQSSHCGSKIPVRTASLSRNNVSRTKPDENGSLKKLNPLPNKVNVNADLHPLPSQSNNPDTDLVQMTESGFVSDLSATNSGCSQLPTDLQHSISSNGLDNIDTAANRAYRRPNNYKRATLPKDSSSISNSQIANTALHKENFRKDKRDEFKKQMQVVQVSNCKRPQSLTCESELLLTKLNSKRSSDVPMRSLPSPFPVLEHSSMLQDVNNLKVMLLKLRRCLAQNADTKTPNDSLMETLFHTGCPVSTNTKEMTREELEMNYEKLLNRNAELEQLLQSRERVIAKMQNQKSDKVTLRENHSKKMSPRMTFADRSTQSTTVVQRNSYHWSNLKLPTPQL